tara:strand:+ start:111 stop:251 length:141 start_codon:yes stop_codon:yes gene_type:complete
LAYHDSKDQWPDTGMSMGAKNNKAGKLADNGASANYFIGLMRPTGK